MNLLQHITRDKIISRFNLLSKNSVRLWGKMNANQMVCHCSDQILMATGKIEVQFIGNFIQRTILKNLILLGIPAPKGKVKTYKELDQKVAGTKPVTFENDKANLINTIRDFDKNYSNDFKIVHPTFGEMSKKQWGRLIYIHLDHHLKQFGV